MYPDAGPLNYQNFVLLRLFINCYNLEKHTIIKSYRNFFEKHINYSNQLNNSMFFYNKIKKENIEILLEIVNNKLGTKYSAHTKDVFELNDKEL
jgi:predicted metal-dependent hydrolase